MFARRRAEMVSPHALASRRRRGEAIGVPLLRRVGPEFETLMSTARDQGAGYPRPIVDLDQSRKRALPSIPG